ncbi:MAG: hypothetical protein WCV80_00265 [Candidatus Paceibacterota bacterium]|jgi:hypothetical protein
MSEQRSYTTNPGDHLVIQITGIAQHHIAEVVSSDPLIVKVMEHGPYAKLKTEDFVIDEELSAKYQKGDAKEWDVLYREAKERGCPFLSGLTSVGTKGDTLYELIGASEE